MTTTSPTTAPAYDAVRSLPLLGRPRALKLPTVADRTLDNGLRVLAVRRPGVPLVEIRLRLPFAGPRGKRLTAHVAQAQLLGDTLLSGTDRRDASQIAIELQTLGGQLNATTDADRLGLGGSVLTTGLPGLLDLLGELLTSASYPKREVEGERDRLVHELAIYRSQPSVLAREALLRKMYGDHPYGCDLPRAKDVGAVRPAQLRALHAKRVAPPGGVLTLVGDLSPARAIGLVENALAGWSTKGTGAKTPALPRHVPGVATLVDRPGAVQTTLRMARPVPGRTDADYPALTLANLVFGGYFSSRWVANIREDKGYTYSPNAVVEHPPAGSRLVLAADVATGVTAPAMLETLYELGRLATVPVGQDELDQARRYAIGSLALGTASQAGIASTLSLLAGAGLGLEWLREHPALLAKVTVDDVRRVALQHFSPSGFTTVLVGDAAAVGTDLAAVLAFEPASDTA